MNSPPQQLTCIKHYQDVSRPVVILVFQDIESSIQYINTIDQLLGNRMITNHIIVDHSVCRTTFNDDVFVYVNYNDYEVQIDTFGGTEVIAPFGYYVE